MIRHVGKVQMIALGSPSIIRQCLDRGLVDRIRFNLVPLLLGWSATGFISFRCPGGRPEQRQ